MPADPAATPRSPSRGGPLRRLATALALAAAAPALAGPPYVTDDPVPTDTGKWEIYAFDADTDFARAFEGGGGIDLNYGAAPGLQVSAVVSAAYRHDDGTRTQAGLADTELGFKYRILRQRDGSWLPSLAVFPKLELPTAGHRFGSGRVGAQIPLWAEEDVGPWSLFGGGGWQLNPGPGNRDYAFWGVALTRQVADALSIGGEIYHEDADATDTRASTGLGIGASWRIAPHWSIIGSGGPVIQHSASTGRYALYLALAFHD